jgi:hypothetical protein
MTILSNEKPKTYKFAPKCIECDKVFPTNNSKAKSCSADCRKAFANRRMLRGAALYDLLYISRFDRSKVSKERADEFHNAAYKLLRAFADFDKKNRPGRIMADPSVFDLIPLAISDEGIDTLGSLIEGGDKRKPKKVKKTRAKRVKKAPVA